MRTSRFQIASAWLVFALLASIAPAQQQPSPTAPRQPRPAVPQEQEAVVRITTQLVQIDVVVTDNKDNHVDSLKESDFELLVNGKRQTISHFALVRQPEAKPEPVTGSKPAAPRPASMPNQPLAPEQVKRTIAFVVDDLGLSFESTYWARRAIKKFVDEQMQEGDLVGIIRTGRGLGALQQFTSDRRVLYAAIEKLVWNPTSRNMRPRFGAGTAAQRGGSDEEEDEVDRLEEFRETVFSVGTLGALNFVVRGLRELPGRKMAVLISDGFRLFSRGSLPGSRSGSAVDNNLVLQRVRRLVDLANRSSVVIYSLDARGLQTLMPTAADNMGGLTAQQITRQIQRASQENFESQDGMVFLARETGGFAVLNNNDLNLGIQRVLRDSQSYYLLGFDPEDQQFNGRFHSIKVRVKRSGLRVRTRAGFFGVAETEAREQPQRTRGAQILSALFSPFGARDLPVQMTSLFFNSAQGGSFVRSMLHFDVSKLTFKDDAGGDKLLALDLAAFAFDENGQVVDQNARTFSMRFDQAQYQAVLGRGLVYNADMAIKKPGAYQFRIVLRDSETGRLGSAGQFLQVPDLAKNRLALSGLSLSAPTDQTANQPGAPANAATQQAASGASAQQTESGDVQPTPAVRRFARESDIEYAAAIYNAALNPQTGQPQLTTQVELYRDGKSIYQSAVRPVETSGQSDLKRLVAGGQLRIKGLPPGDYLLRFIVTDGLVKPKYARAEQWMDFSVR